MLEKGTKGLGVNCEYNGGTQNRSKKVWGVLVPDYDDSPLESTNDSVYISSYDVVMNSDMISYLHYRVTESDVKPVVVMFHRVCYNM